LTSVRISEWPRLGATLLLLLSAGCADTSVVELRRQNTQLKDQLAQKDHDLVAQQTQIHELNSQLATARAFTKDDLQKIFFPDKLEIDSLSGGENYDNNPGDDGVTVYLKPIDRDGDVIKVAGDIRIELFDLSKAGDNLIAKVHVPVEQVSKMWYGKLMTYHYTVRVPWQKGPPSNPEVTVRATFVDYLTQRVLTAQTVVKVKPTAGGKP
jgi:hypothetical protein